MSEDERRKLISKKHGNWYCFCDLNKVQFIGLIDVEYPERQSWAFLSELQQSFIRICPAYFTESNEFISKRFNEEFKNIMEKYNDPSVVDDISNIQGKMFDATGIMLQNIETAIENTGGLNQIEAKTKYLLEDAKGLEV